MIAEGWFHAEPPELAARLARVHDRVARAQGGASIEGALTSRAATPFLALTEALRKDLGLPDEGAIDAVGQGTLALYFYLRLQDDMVDEPATFDATHTYAAEVFAGLSAEAFASAVGGSVAFWSLRRSVLHDLAAVSAWEIDRYRGVDLALAAERVEEDAARLGDKLSPVAIPLAACAAAAREESAFEWIRALARHLGRALQIANDLLNARDDHAARRLTPSLAALYSGGRVTPGDEPFRVWPALASDPSFDRMLAIARREAASASAAVPEDRPTLREAVGTCAAVLEEIPTRLLALSLGARR